MGTYLNEGWRVRGSRRPCFERNRDQLECRGRHGIWGRILRGDGVVTCRRSEGTSKRWNESGGKGKRRWHESGGKGKRRWHESGGKGRRRWDESVSCQSSCQSGVRVEYN